MANPQGFTIFKYQIPIQEDFKLTLPICHKAIRVDFVDGKAWMWVLHDLRKESARFTFHMYKTGGTIPDNVMPKLDPIPIGFLSIYVQQELCLYVFTEKENETDPTDLRSRASGSWPD